MDEWSVDDMSSGLIDFFLPIYVFVGWLFCLTALIQSQQSCVLPLPPVVFT